MDHQNNSSSKRNGTAAMNLISKDDSALHSMSLLNTSSPTNRETAQHEREQTKKPNNKVVLKTAVKKINKEEVSSRFSLRLFVKKLERKTRQD